jgi:hypothetical protein
MINWTPTSPLAIYKVTPRAACVFQQLQVDFRKDRFHFKSPTAFYPN